MLVVADHGRREVYCARDPLGDRTLCYVLRDGWLAIASEECALLSLPEVSARLDERSVARFFAVEAPTPDATFFADVRELPPAHALVVTAEAHRLWRYWRLEQPEPLRYRCDEEYGEHFRSVVGQAVRCRLRSRWTPAVLMSGGLDSTSVAAFAAEALGPGLRAISWVFDEVPGADERIYIEAMAERFELQRVWVNGDGAWPLRDLATWPVNPNTPITGMYARLAQATYAAARGAGSPVILNGEFGDQLFDGGEFWLADLLRAWRVAAAAGGLLSHVRESLRARRSPSLRLRPAVGRALGIPPRKVSHGQHPWLTEEARNLLGDGGAGDLETHTRRPTQVRRLFDPLWARGNAMVSRESHLAGIEMRRPYRDLRLMRFALALPGHQLYRPGWTKWIVRRSLEGRIPEVVRLRRAPTSLTQLGRRGLLEREASRVRALLTASKGWASYVRPEWIERQLAGWPSVGVAGRDSLVPWWCLCFELWRCGTGLELVGEAELRTS